MGMATTTEKDEEGSETTTTTITVPPCDVICGPGNQWVTAAKSIVQGKCGIDMMGGPSEVLVICDDTAIPAVVAADLIAQAEHDVVARAILLCTCPKTIHEVDTAVHAQVQALPEPNRSTALAALQHSFAVHCFDLQQAIELSDAICPGTFGNPNPEQYPHWSAMQELWWLIYRRQCRGGFRRLRCRSESYVTDGWDRTVYGWVVRV